MFPLFICTLFIWGNWERNACPFLLLLSYLFIYFYQRFESEILFRPLCHLSRLSCWWWSWLIFFFNSRSEQLMLRQTDTSDVSHLIPHGLIWTEKLWCAVLWNNKLNLKLIRVLSADQSGDYIYRERESSGSGGAGGGGAVLDLKLSWGTLSICAVDTDRSYGFD